MAALPVYGDAALIPELRELLTDLPTPPVPAAEILSDPVDAENLLTKLLGQVETLLSTLGTPTAAALLLPDDALRRRLSAAATAVWDWARQLDQRLDSCAVGWTPKSAEAVQEVLRQLTDRLYGVLQDRIEIAERARALAPGEPSFRSATSYTSIEIVLAAIDRLEVRGRDSAGITIWVHLDAPVDATETSGLASRLAGRADPLLRNGSAVVTSAGACFVYKHAAVVGKLGDNVGALRRAIRRDAELHELLARPSATITVLSHTRWASVGRISEANAHPVDNRGEGSSEGPLALAVLNGDIDNYLSLLERAEYRPSELAISTDAKLIPALLARQLTNGHGPGEVLRACLSDFAGSMAIAAQVDSAAGQVLLAVKGSGQSLYVGLAPTGFIVASETYGLVASTRDFIRVDGAPFPGATHPGTVITLNRVCSGTLPGIWRVDGDGLPRPVGPAEVRVAEVTTRDLALGTAQHYLHKEIHEAPISFRKTLRGRIRPYPAGLRVALPESSLPDAVRARFGDGKLTEIIVIGQGTAAVACQGIAQLMRAVLGETLTVSAQPASEFSAWHLRADMSRTCVVAVSQSGTTTDTNRSVDLARERGAAILSIVNRRDADLATKSHGVLYTSDGRDVELSVASTKAFYAQIAAGCLLGLEIARARGVLSGARESGLLEALNRIPDQLLALRKREQLIADVAAEVATRYPYWAVVGSGPNRVATAEIRIKLSELCYKTISTDAVEDKKHIDLSAEALVLVCVAGAPPNQVSDLIKEVEILAAHGNRPVVFCDEGTEQVWPADLVIGLPPAHPELMWILTTAAGHLFGYYAARRIDAAADDMRTALAKLEAAVDGGLASGELPGEVLVQVAAVLDEVGQGALRGVLTSQTTMKLVHLAWQPKRGGLAGEFSAEAGDPVDLARATLTHAIEELARPIDTVKHQAKTVTVGTSRDDADLYENAVVEALETAGADRYCLTLAALRMVRAHARLIGSVTGVTRYRIRHAEGGLTIKVVSKTGIAAGIPSRADQESPLVGSKRRVVELRVPRLLRGASDGRVVLVVPEQDGSDIGHVAVVHVVLRPRCPLAELAAAMESVGDRMAEIVAAVTETSPSFEPGRLSALPAEDVLLAPVEWLAQRLCEDPRPEDSHAEDPRAV